MEPLTLNADLPQKPIIFGRVAVEDNIGYTQRGEIAKGLCQELAAKNINLSIILSKYNPVAVSNYAEQESWYRLNFPDSMQSTRLGLVTTEIEPRKISTDGVLTGTRFFNVYDCKAPEFLVRPKNPKDFNLDVPELIKSNPNHFFNSKVSQIVTDPKTGQSAQYD